jgi:hypothetical protein
MVSFLSGPRHHKAASAGAPLRKEVTASAAAPRCAVTNVINPPTSKKRKRNKGKTGSDSADASRDPEPAPTASAIDDIFSSASSKKKEEKVKNEEKVKASKISASDKAAAEKPAKQPMQQHGVIASAYGTIISPDPPVERIDKESGLKVYKAHLLRIGEGGGTPLCPFDCDCCF